MWEAKGNPLGKTWSCASIKDSSLRNPTLHIREKSSLYDVSKDHHTYLVSFINSAQPTRKTNEVIYLLSLSHSLSIIYNRVDYKIPEDRIVLHMGFGFHAPELEVVILARTGVATIPIAIKDFWLQG